MQKLKLDLESITVESFEAHPAGYGRAPGTVHAHEGEAEAAQLVQTLPLSDCVFSACRTCGIYC